MTPAPQMVPLPGGSDSEKIDALEHGLGQAMHAIGKVWDARKDSDRLDKLEHRLQTSTNEGAELGALLREFVMPGLKASMARIDLLLTHHEGNRVRQSLFYDKDWPAFVKAFEGLSDRLGRVERSMESQQSDMRALGERFAQSQGALGARVTVVESIGNSHDVRITALERVNEDAKTVDNALAKQERNKTTKQSAAAAVLIAIASWIVQHFTK